MGTAGFLLYALGLGLGTNPTDRARLNYVYEGLDGESLQVLPTFANVLAYPGFWASEPDTGITWKKVVHAEQQIVLHSPLPSRGAVAVRTRVTALWDKGVHLFSMQFVPRAFDLVGCAGTNIETTEDRQSIAE